MGKALSRTVARDSAGLKLVKFFGLLCVVLEICRLG